MRNSSFQSSESEELKWEKILWYFFHATQKLFPQPSSHAVVFYVDDIFIFLLVIPELIFYISFIHSLLAVLVLPQFFFGINYSSLVFLINIFLTRLSVTLTISVSQKRQKFLRPKNGSKTGLWLLWKWNSKWRWNFLSSASNKSNDSSLVSTRKMIINHFSLSPHLRLFDTKRHIDFNCFFRFYFRPHHRNIRKRLSLEYHRFAQVMTTKIERKCWWRQW